MMAAASGDARRVLVYGGRGALGTKCVQAFRAKDWWVASIDVVENEEANASVIVKMTDSFTEQADQVTVDVGKLLGDKKVDAILCVAGGWAGGSAKAKSLFKNCDLMWKQSMWTSTISSHLATRHLKEGGLLTLAGAKAALDGTPGMIGYGMAKGAVHQLCQSLAGENSGMPPGSAAIAVLPVTLDTPMNRKSMPDADFSAWTPLEFLVEQSLNQAGTRPCPAFVKHGLVMHFDLWAETKWSTPWEHLPSVIGAWIQSWRGRTSDLPEMRQPGPRLCHVL